jgi:hypothetical protein
MLFGLLPSFSTLSPWSAKHGMPGSDWPRYAGEKFAAATTAADRRAALNALGQGLHAIQDAYAHDLADVGMWEHFLALFGLRVDPDNPTENPITAEYARIATISAVRDFMKGRGDKPKCAQPIP